jgi:hypothetical protein
VENTKLQHGNNPHRKENNRIILPPSTLLHPPRHHKNLAKPDISNKKTTMSTSFSPLLGQRHKPGCPDKDTPRLEPRPAKENGLQDDDHLGELSTPPVSNGLLIVWRMSEIP